LLKLAYINEAVNVKGLEQWWPYLCRVCWGARFHFIFLWT